MKLRSFFTFWLLLAAGVAAAQRPSLEVESVQMPAWVERANGSRAPLDIGMTLGNRDRIYTGPGSKALLRLADGSTVKLGENAVLGVDDLAQRKAGVRDLVTASLDVVTGAFRFTTQAIYKFRGERDVRVRIATITAGIRGTDLWGKSDASRDLVCLIEGNITVSRGQDAFTMDQPLSFYVAPRNQPAQPVATVSRDQLQAWAGETDIATGSGAARKGGRWRVYVAQARTQDEVLTFYDSLRSSGYAAEIRPISGADGLTYHVRISNLPSRQEAEVLAGKLKGQMGITDPRVSL